MNRAQSASIRSAHPHERATTLGIGLALLDVRLRLLTGLRATLRQLDVERPDAPLDQSGAQELAGRVDGVLAQLRPLVGEYPLARPLTLFRLLRRRGVPIEVHVGVRDGTDGPIARCWLSHQGRPLFEGDDPGEGFESVYRYCSRSERQFHIPIEVVDGGGEAVIEAWRTLAWSPAH